MVCFIEKNIFIGWVYYGVIVYYNGYFNVNDLLCEVMKNYQNNFKEDFFNVLFICLFLIEEEVKNMYVFIDIVIVKCIKVIINYVMLGMDKFFKKKEEYNKWIDENWIIIGCVYFICWDYDVVLKDFNYVKKFFLDDFFIYVVEVWIVKMNIQFGNYIEVMFFFKNLDKVLEDQEFGGKFKLKFKKKKKGKKKDYEEEFFKFFKLLKLEFYIMKVQFVEVCGDKEEEIKNFEMVLKFVKKKLEKLWINFIFG